MTKLTEKEQEYIAFLDVPRTTKELQKHFSAEKNAVWQMTRTLRLKQMIHRVQIGNESYWKITEDADDAPPIPVTSLQREYIKYLQSSHSTKDMMAEFGKKEHAVQQVTRTLRLMGWVESIGRGSSRGHGGCWNLWKSTADGIEALEME